MGIFSSTEQILERKYSKKCCEIRKTENFNKGRQSNPDNIRTKGNSTKYSCWLNYNKFEKWIMKPGFIISNLKMIPKRNSALRISQMPDDFAASVEAPDVVQCESPVHSVRDEGRSIFDKVSDTTSTDMDHSSTAIEPPSMYPSEPAAVTHHPQIIDSDVEDFTCKLDTMIA